MRVFHVPIDFPNCETSCVPFFAWVVSCLHHLVKQVNDPEFAREAWATVSRAGLPG
jgi:hypothetical protein